MQIYLIHINIYLLVYLSYECCCSIMVATENGTFFACALCFHVNFFQALYNIFERIMVWCLYLVH
jgi:hypothetical protein